jgi:hypothetical protein
VQGVLGALRCSLVALDRGEIVIPLSRACSVPRSNARGSSRYAVRLPIAASYPVSPCPAGLWHRSRCDGHGPTVSLLPDLGALYAVCQVSLDTGTRKAASGYHGAKACSAPVRAGEAQGRRRPCPLLILRASGTEHVFLWQMCSTGSGVSAQPATARTTADPEHAALLVYARAGAGAGGQAAGALELRASAASGTPNHPA